MSKEKKDFEKSFEKMKACAAALTDPDVKLEQAIEQYREGIEHYRICSGILEEAKQLIELYDRETDELTEI